MELLAVTDKEELQSIRTGLESVYKLCITKGEAASREGKQLEMSAFFEDANNIQRIIRTLRSV